MTQEKTSSKPRFSAYIFRPYRKHPKTGEIIWAKDYGLKAWRIPVSEKKLN